MSIINAFPQSQDSVGGGIDYSLKEQDTGLKWIDGKPIYQKTIDCGNLPNATTKFVPHGIDNVDTFCGIDGFASNSTNGAILPIPFINSDYEKGFIQCSSNKTDITLVSGNDRTIFIAYVTLRYTKTT